MNIVAIILARGGSKGIPGKNKKIFCGKPLICWTIEQVKRSKLINSVWLSSDDNEILSIAKNENVEIIRRPLDISGDNASSESGWIHAINYIENIGQKIDHVIALQATSPLRETKDIDNAIEYFQKENLDSLFSGSELRDFFIWKRINNKLDSVNYDYQKRQRRQDIPTQYVENGSFYIFRPEILKKYNNRLGGSIGVSLMELWKSFELDSLEDWKMCEVLMKGLLK